MLSLAPALPDFALHPSAALWIAASRTAVLADVHLGYSWAQRRRGELGPLADFQTREKLLALCDDLHPQSIVFLGDLVHAPRPCAPEREWIEATLHELAGRAALTAIRGNHDRAFAREFSHLPVEHKESWSQPGMTAVHGDRLGSAPLPQSGVLVLGHWHPCLGVTDAAGASHKLPVFLASKSCLVLPAFSPFARGFDIRGGLPEELRQCFRGETVEAFAATKTRVSRLGPLQRAIERLWQADTASPAQFRWPRRAR